MSLLDRVVSLLGPSSMLGTPPPAADAEAERACRAEYGDRYTQVTYWSCASAGVFAGRCGWHVPIVAVDSAAASGGACSMGMVRVVVVVVVSGWLVWAG